MFNLCFPFIPSLFYIVLNDDYMLCKVTLGVLKGASKLNGLLLLLLFDGSLIKLPRTATTSSAMLCTILWTDDNGMPKALDTTR